MAELGPDFPPLSRQDQILQFLKEELAVPADAIALALKKAEDPSSQLPMLLWQYSLIDLEQLEKLLDWLDTL